MVLIIFCGNFSPPNKSLPDGTGDNDKSVSFYNLRFFFFFKQKQNNSRAIVSFDSKKNDPKKDDEIGTMNNGNEGKEETQKLETEQVDPTLNGTVDDIYEKIDSYMGIVKKTTRDMIPKAITLYIVKELQNYIKDNLLLTLLALPNDKYVRTLKKSIIYLLSKVHLCDRLLFH